MAQLIFAVPGDLASLTGGYAYAREVIRCWKAAGHSVQYIPLGDGFPDPSESVMEDACRRLAATPDGATVLIDGLAYGVLPAAFLQQTHRRWVALVHHPLALETGVDPARQVILKASERAALAEASQVIVTSPATARELVASYAVPGQKITVALPGVEAAGRASGGRKVPVLLSVGTLTRRKGHDVLVAALAELRDLDWQCRFVGSTDRDPVVTENLRWTIAGAGLEQRIEIVGEVDGDGLRGEYHQADIFVLASRYEGYGMVFAEAMAHGLPVIACHAGAVPDTVPDSAGILVPVDDPAALAEAIGLVLTDAPRRQALADGAWRHGQGLARWPDTAKTISDIMEQTA
ncbi:MAG: glycosyltransferase family 4 protein [Rhodospirillales bacterium]